MHLEGSCHCRKVRFTVEAPEPVPFMRCYCSICRKTAGAGGYAMNLGADTHSMKVTGKRYLGVYRARIDDDGSAKAHTSPGDPRFDAYPDMSLKEWHETKGLRSPPDPGG